MKELRTQIEDWQEYDLYEFGICYELIVSKLKNNKLRKKDRENLLGYVDILKTILEKKY